LMHKVRAESGKYEIVTFWPGLIDLVTSALMVFLLLSFIQTVLNVDELEALVTRSQQSRFLALFRQQFDERLATGEIAVERHLNFLQITFSDQVLFDSGDHRLKPRGRTMLRRAAQVLAEAADSGYEQIQVEGHTDSDPVRQTEYPSDNWELSAARAISVVRFLTVSGHLEPRIFSANGYADQRPVATNATEAGQAQNRRIELRVFFALTQRPDEQTRG